MNSEFVRGFTKTTISQVLRRFLRIEIVTKKNFDTLNRVKFTIRFFIFSLLFCCAADVSYSHIIPFAFFRVPPPVLNWDFTAMSSLPSTLTFTRTSTATYFDSSGVMQTAAAGTPRFDYDPTTLQPRGLLLEPAATNINVCSENIDLATCWNTEGATPMLVAKDVAVAPDGTMTADRLTQQGDSWTYGTLPTTSANTSYVFSVYVKSLSTNGTIRLAMQEATGAYQLWVTQDVNVTTNWTRVYITGQKTNSNVMRFMIYMGSGHLSQIYAWGAQAELGTMPTSYIKVPSTSPVTRNAETLIFNSLAWLDGTQGTLFAEYMNTRNESSATYRVLGLFATNVSGTFAQNSIEISDNNTTVTSGVTVGSTSQFSPGGAITTAGTVNRQAITYKANSFTSSINRGAITTDTSGTLPTINYGYIGSQPDGNQRSRYIRKIQYYNSTVQAAHLMGL